MVFTRNEERIRSEPSVELALDPRLAVRAKRSPEKSAIEAAAMAGLSPNALYPCNATDPPSELRR